MNYRDCGDFIQNRMRMSHVYQPVMLMTLLKSDGKASTSRKGDSADEVLRLRLDEPEKVLAYSREHTSGRSRTRPKRQTARQPARGKHNSHRKAKAVKEAANVAEGDLCAEVVLRTDAHDSRMLR